MGRAPFIEEGNHLGIVSDEVLLSLPERRPAQSHLPFHGLLPRTSSFREIMFHNADLTLSGGRRRELILRAGCRTYHHRAVFTHRYDVRTGCRAPRLLTGWEPPQDVAMRLHRPAGPACLHYPSSL